MSDPGTAPLLAVAAVGFGSVALSIARSRALWQKGAAFLAAPFLVGLMQSRIRSQSLGVLLAMVGIVMGCAVLVTRGHIEDFWDDDSSPEHDAQVTRNQARTLILAVIPVALLFTVYRDVVSR